MADISRTEVASLIAEEYGPSVLQAATATSVALEAFPTVPMGTRTTHMPVLATLPEAGWVAESATDPSGAKPTAEATWADKTLVAEEIAVIVPVHENVIDDSTEDILDEVARLAGQSIGKALDAAVLFGTGKPASWTSPDLLAAAVAAGQTVANVEGTANASDLYGALVQSAEMVADAGFNPTTLITSLGLRFRLANLRNANGDLAFRDGMFDGFDTYFNRNGAWENASALAFVADPSLVRIGVRQDITVKFLDQATVGGINLAERDMVALRVKARYAYVLGTAATSVGPDQTPVAAVTPDVTP